MMIQAKRCVLNYIRRVGYFFVSTISIYQSGIRGALKARTAENLRLALDVVFVKNAPISIAGTGFSKSYIVVQEPPMSVRTLGMGDGAFIVVKVHLHGQSHVLQI